MAGFNNWRDAIEVVLAAGSSASKPPHFDEVARAADVAKQVAEERKYPIWPIGIVALMLLFPNGWILALIAGAMWCFVVRAAIKRSNTLRTQLDTETVKLRDMVHRNAAAVEQALLRANTGDVAGLKFLLERWLDRRPDCIRTFTAQVTKRLSGEFVVSGDAIRREMIPTDTTRLASGGRVAHDKRSATDIDEDLTELNAIAVLSLVFAIVNVPTRHRLTIRMEMQTESGPIPWVTLSHNFGKSDLYQVESALQTLRPSECIRQLGGDLGECRRRRFYAAQEPASPGTGVSAKTFVTVDHSKGDLPAVPASAALPASITLPAGLTHVSGSGVAVPPPSTRTNDRAPVATASSVRGSFSAAAQRFANYAGNATANFTPFQSYWPTYEGMTPDQLQFYFYWRTRVRAGEQIRTDLSYIFVHIYELLHLIGAAEVSDAGKQLEVLWMGYRATFPKLDTYCSRWLVDLYLSEGKSDQAAAAMARILELGIKAADEEALVSTDRLWAEADYKAMPLTSICELTSDSRLGTTKFYTQYNEAGWIDRAFCEALRVADDAYHSKFGRRLRDATMDECGVRVVSRDPFRSAVYDWQRKPVILGTIVRLTPKCTAVQIYKNSTAYTENLLRARRGFNGRLRGVEVGPILAPALEKFVAQYVEATRPRARLVIDAAKARQLSIESSEARARLLVGLETEGASEPAPPVESAAKPEVARQAPDMAQRTPGALLTDLAPITAALAASHSATRAVLDALVDAHWELAISDERMLAASGGALLESLIAEVNNRLRDQISGTLLVIENGIVVVQDDYRDEVYYACRGTLTGFARDVSAVSASTVAEASPVSDAYADAHGFSPVEMRAVGLISRGGASMADDLATLAATNATTPLLIIDRINELALASPYGDLVIDTLTSPPTIIEEAAPYVSSLLASTPAL